MGSEQALVWQRRLTRLWHVPVWHCHRHLGRTSSSGHADPEILTLPPPRSQTASLVAHPSLPQFTPFSVLCFQGAKGNMGEPGEPGQKGRQVSVSPTRGPAPSPKAGFTPMARCSSVGRPRHRRPHRIPRTQGKSPPALPSHWGHGDKPKAARLPVDVSGPAHPSCPQPGKRSTSVF